jgi:hypothetical protein
LTGGATAAGAAAVFVVVLVAVFGRDASKPASAAIDRTITPINTAISTLRD